MMHGAKLRLFERPTWLTINSSFKFSQSCRPRAIQNSGSVNNGAPRREASSMLRRVKDWSNGLTISVMGLQTNSHLLMLRDKPMLSPSSFIRSTSAVTLIWLSPTVRSSGSPESTPRSDYPIVAKLRCWSVEVLVGRLVLQYYHNIKFPFYIWQCVVNKNKGKKHTIKII